MRQGNFSEVRDVDLRPADRPALPRQRHPRKPHQPHQPGDRQRHLPGAEPAGPRQQLHREPRAHPDRERGRRARGLSHQRPRLALRALLDGEAGLRRRVARQHLHGQRRPTRATNNSESNNYNGVHRLHADPGLEQVLRVPRRLQPLLDAPVRGGLRHRQEQRARDPQREPRRLSGDVGPGQLPSRRASPSTGSPGTTNAIRVGTTYNLTGNLSWIREQPQLQGRRRRAPRQRRRLQPADAAAGPLHLRPELHEQPRRHRHRLLVRDDAARLPEPRAARPRGHLAAHQAQLRRRVRPGRLPASTGSCRCSSACAGTS